MFADRQRHRVRKATETKAGISFSKKNRAEG